MSYPGRGPALALGLAGLLSGSVAAQSPIGFRFQSGEAGTSFLNSRIVADRLQSLQERTWREWVRLRANLFLFDPRFIDLTAEVQPTRVQSVFRADDEERSDGQSFQGSASLSLLSNRTIRTVLRAGRSDASVSGRFGEQFELRQESWGGTLQDLDRIFPTEIFYEDLTRDLNRLPVAGIPASRSGERTRTFRFNARNTKTSIRAERIHYEPRYSGAEFVRRLGSFDHSLRWGKGSYLQSGLSYSDRSGLVPFSQVSWSERARLMHYAWLWSEYSYDFRRQNDGLEARLGRTNLAWKLAHDLRLDLTGLAQITRSDIVRREYAHVFPTVRLSTLLPRGARLTSAFSIGYEWHSQNARQDAYFGVLQEPHTVDASGQFRLDKPFADPASLVVGSADGRELYQEGTDFRVVASGPYVDVLVLPGSRIAEGDDVVVDYRVRSVPTVDGNARTLNLDARLTLGPLDLYHRRYRQESLADLPPGTLPILSGEDRCATGADVNWSWRMASVAAFGEHSRDRTDLFDFTGSRVGGSAGLRLGRLSVSGSSHRTHSEDERTGARHDVILSQGTAEWQFNPDLRLSLFLADWTLQSDAYEESMVGGGGVLEWRVGRTRLNAKFDRIRREDGTDRTENRIFINLRRAF